MLYDKDISLFYSLNILDILGYTHIEGKRHKSCFPHHRSGENNDNNASVMCCSPRGSKGFCIKRISFREKRKHEIKIRELRIVACRDTRTFKSFIRYT